MQSAFPWRGALAAALHYTAAFLLTTLAHELAHAVVATLLHGQPVLHNIWVDTRNEALLPVGAKVAIALAGPLLSLVQGLLFLTWAWRRRGAGDAALWRLYLGLFGLINFMGYLLIGPLVPYGDIGQVEALWHWPAWATVGLAVAAGLGVQFAVASTGPLFLDQGPGLALPARRRLLQALVALPWLLGSALITALSWPWPTPISLLYPILSNMVLGTAWGRAMRQPYPADASAPVSLLAGLHLGRAVGALLAVGIVFRLLAGGVAL